MSRIIDTQNHKAQYALRENPPIDYGSLDTPMSAAYWCKAAGASLVLFSCLIVFMFGFWMMG